MREILFVAGEVSGDQHAAGVVRALRAANAPFRLTGVGGDNMRDAGVELLVHASALAHLGFVEPLKHLPQYRRLRRDLRTRMRSGEVALVVLVDYGGFNMKVAAAARAEGVPVLYYITPQVWASRAGRMKDLARTVTRAAVILPFEETLLRDNGIDATFVGHPLMDRIDALPTRAEARRTIGVGPTERLLALFPGSRRQEIALHLAPFVATARELQRRDPTLRVVVSAAPHVTISPAECPFPLAHASSLTLLRAADAAMCKSGTTTLEAAVALCPMVVAYRVDRITYTIAKYLITIPRIGLVNVVAGRDVAPEFVQDALQPIPVANALEPLLNVGSPARAAMLLELERVRSMLGTPGASRRVAAMALDMATAGGARDQ